MLDPMLLNLVATALVLFAVGHVAGFAHGRLAPGAGLVAVVSLVGLSVALVLSATEISDWPVLFFLSFALGFRWGEAEDRVARPTRAAVALGLAFAVVAVLVGVTYQWWYGPVALLAALLIGLARQLWYAVREVRQARSTGRGPPAEPAPPDHRRQ